MNGRTMQEQQDVEIIILIYDVDETAIKPNLKTGFHLSPSHERYS